MRSSFCVVLFMELPTGLPYSSQSHWHTPDLTAVYNYHNTWSYTGYRYKRYNPASYWLPESRQTGRYGYSDPVLSFLHMNFRRNIRKTGFPTLYSWLPLTHKKHNYAYGQKEKRMHSPKLTVNSRSAPWLSHWHLRLLWPLRWLMHWRLPRKTDLPKPYRSVSNPVPRHKPHRFSARVPVS